MAVTLKSAQASLNALKDLSTNAFVAQLASHAFTDHISKSAFAATAQGVTKGYFERINSTPIHLGRRFQGVER